MKINSSSTPTALFSEIEVGEVFWSEGEYFMRIQEEKVDVGNEYIDINTVNLTTGFCGTMCDDEEVVRVNCELVTK